MKKIIYFIIAISLLAMIISKCTKAPKLKVVWPEYDHTKPYNPFSDKNPKDSITVGDPTNTDVIVVNPAKPTPFPGMYD